MCEIYNQLKAAGFSNIRRCIYEPACAFGTILHAAEVAEVDVASQCQAAKDEITSSIAETPEDFEIENYIKSLVCISRVN